MDEGQSGPTAHADQETRRGARWLAQLNLALLAAGFAWFAYVDAPITDGAMWLFSGAALAGMLSVMATLLSGEAAARAAGTRWRRAALLLFMAALALMLTAATLTLNLKGTGSDDADTATTVAARAQGLSAL